MLTQPNIRVHRHILPIYQILLKPMYLGNQIDWFPSIYPYTKVFFSDPQPVISTTTVLTINNSSSLWQSVEKDPLDSIMNMEALHFSDVAFFFYLPGV